MKLYLSFCLLLITVSNNSPQIKPDTLLYFHDSDSFSEKSEHPIPDSARKEITFPLLKFQWMSRLNQLDQRFLNNYPEALNKKKEAYSFDKEELNSGLSEKDLIAYRDNKTELLSILRGNKGGKVDETWAKIENFLRDSKKTVAFLLAIIHLIKYRGHY